MATDGAALAAELAARVDAEARMATALVELERHPGHLTLAAGTCTGVTGERWMAASAALAGLWEDFATFRGVLLSPPSGTGGRPSSSTSRRRSRRPTPCVPKPTRPGTGPRS